MSKTVKQKKKVEKEETITSELKWSNYSIKENKEVKRTYDIIEKTDKGKSVLGTIAINQYFSSKDRKQTFFLNKTKTDGLNLSISNWSDYNPENRSFGESVYENYFISKKQKDSLALGLDYEAIDGTVQTVFEQTFFYFEELKE